MPVRDREAEGSNPSPPTNLKLAEIADTGASTSTRGGSPVDGTRTIQGSSSAGVVLVRRGNEFECPTGGPSHG